MRPVPRIPDERDATGRSDEATVGQQRIELLPQVPGHARHHAEGRLYPGEHQRTSGTYRSETEPHRVLEFPRALQPVENPLRNSRAEAGLAVRLSVGTADQRYHATDMEQYRPKHQRDRL